MEESAIIAQNDHFILLSVLFLFILLTNRLHIGKIDNVESIIVI